MVNILSIRDKDSTVFVNQQDLPPKTNLTRFKDGTFTIGNHEDPAIQAQIDIILAQARTGATSTANVISSS